MFRVRFSLAILFLVVPTLVVAQQEVWYESIEEALTRPEAVYNLKLKRKGLKKFPAELCRFPNLEKLDLSKNRIKVFPDSLMHLSTLVYLNLSRNEISEIPVHITELKALEHLDLWDNYIVDLPKEVIGLKKLNYLDIRGVALTEKKYAEYSVLMNTVELHMSEPCNCQE